MKKEQIICKSCTSKKAKDHNTSQRRRYGVSRCDTYNMDYTLGIIISNALVTYIEKGKEIIIRDDWDIIEKHAKAIRDYAKADCWYDSPFYDKENIKAHKEWKQIKKDWKEAMNWLRDNWNSLWW